MEKSWRRTLRDDDRGKPIFGQTQSIRGRRGRGWQDCWEKHDGDRPVARVKMTVMLRPVLLRLTFIAQAGTLLPRIATRLLNLHPLRCVMIGVAEAGPRDVQRFSASRWRICCPCHTTKSSCPRSAACAAHGPPAGARGLDRGYPWLGRQVKRAVTTAACVSDRRRMAETGRRRGSGAADSAARRATPLALEDAILSRQNQNRRTLVTVGFRRTGVDRCWMLFERKSRKERFSCV